MANKPLQFVLVERKMNFGANAGKIVQVARDESVGKKIRNASKEWIPYIFVVGDNEKESGKFSPRLRPLLLPFLVPKRRERKH